MLTVNGQNMFDNDYLNRQEDELRKSSVSKERMQSCMEYAERLTLAGLPVIFDARHLSLLIGISLKNLMGLTFGQSDKLYQERIIPKKHSEAVRTLRVPNVSLRYIQKWILEMVLDHMHVSDHAHGFVRERSILTNASVHVQKRCVYNTDIRDFFPSISFERVFKIFAYYGYNKQVAFMLAKLCTCDGYLPQGSPASPYLSNIVCLKLDKRLSNLAKTFNADYTRYADDITISGGGGILSSFETVETIIRDEGFTINHQKTRMAFSHQRQVVTGLIVNGKDPKIPKRYRKDLMREIYYCKTYGPYEHQLRTKDKHMFYKEHLYGKAYFVYMVDKKEGKKMLQSLDEISWSY